MPVMYPWSTFKGPSKHCTEMCTAIVSCLTNISQEEELEETGEVELEEVEEGELKEAEKVEEENGENNLVLQLSVDWEEESQHEPEQSIKLV